MPGFRPRYTPILRVLGFRDRISPDVVAAFGW